MKLSEAVSLRLAELLREKEMSGYRLFKQTGTHQSTISNTLHCKTESVTLRVVHEICQGLGITLKEFFDSELFDEEQLEP